MRDNKARSLLAALSNNFNGSALRYAILYKVCASQEPAHFAEPMFQKLLPAGRFLILIAVVGALFAAVTVLIYGIFQTAQLITGVFSAGAVSTKGAKGLALGFIEVVDLFLLGTVFYIIALGLYELFIDAEVAVPKWLVISNLDDLKGKLVSVVIVILSILFLGQVVSWDGERNLLPYGGATALVIAALTYFLSQKGK